MVCVKAGRYLDRHRGWVELTPGPGAITYVSQDSAAFRERPECFLPASAEQQAVRSGETMRWSPAAPVLSPTPAKPASRRGFHFDARTKRWVDGRTRSATPRPRPPHAPAGTAAPPPIASPWDLGPTPKAAPAPPRCQVRHEPDAISTQLTLAARGELWGIAERRTGKDDLEVGGLLFGELEGERMIVRRATESPGRRERDRFSFDSQADLAEAERLHADEGLQLLGVWHSHAERGHSQLSGMDLRSAAAWRQELDAPVLFALLSRDAAGRWQFHPHICREPSFRGGASILAPSRLLR